MENGTAVVTTGSPELENLAVALSAVDSLHSYIHPFQCNPDRFSRLAALIPGGIKSELAKRYTPLSLRKAELVSAAPLDDLARAALGGRFPALSHSLLWDRDRRLSNRAVELSKRVDSMVVSHACAWRALRNPARMSSVIMNMQSCHPAFRARTLESELATLPKIRDRPTIGYSNRMLKRFEFEFSESDGILVGSRFAKATLVDEGVDEEKVWVVPYGVDLGKFVPGTRSLDHSFRVLYVGSLTPGKGIHYLLQAYREFHKADSSLNIVGPAPHGLEWLGGMEGVTYHGRLVGSALLSMFQSSDVIVMPTLYEGLPLTSLEAMACGLPAIVTSRGADDVVRNGREGFVIEAGEPSAITNKLDELYYDRSLLSEMRRSARIRAEQLSWATYQRRALEVVLPEAGGNESC